MTYRNLMISVLERVTGQPRAHLAEIIKAIETEGKAVTGAKGHWDEEVPFEKQKEMEKNFAAEASGIVAWYARTLQATDHLREGRIHSIRQEHAKK